MAKVLLEKPGFTAPQMDVERAAKNFSRSSFLPIQQNWLEATRLFGVTTPVSDNRSTSYDIFITMKKES